MYACDFIFNCLSIYLTKFRIYLLLRIDNIRTVSENIKFLRDSEKWVEKRGFINFCELFCSECKIILHFPKMYVYCVDPVISKNPKTTAKLFEKSLF